MNEENAQAILKELIQKPGSDPSTIAGVFAEILAIHKAQFSPTPEPVKKRRTRRSKLTKAGNPRRQNVGWPLGVSRAEYIAWRDTTWNSPDVEDHRNPWGYHRLREAGAFSSPPGTPYPESMAAQREANRTDKIRKQNKAARDTTKANKVAKAAETTMVTIVPSTRRKVKA